MGQQTVLGIVGLGVISRAYLDTLAGHPAIRIAAVADLDAARAEAVAGGIPGARALTVPELMDDPEVDMVVNLTVPGAHAEIALAAISAGKGVYGEKPLAASFDDGREIVRAGARAGVAVGSAPDTVLGTGVQTARAAVESGLIGRPTSASATWVSAGHEQWHPHPDFYYRPGGGPLFDMGPYYLTTLVHLLGPVVAVTGASSRRSATRKIATGPRAGVSIDVDVDTHVVGILEHAGGALSTVTFSFDAVASTASPLEVHGALGSLAVPDPNLFDGVVRVRRHGSPEWEELPAAAGYEEASRGIGLLDLVARGASRGRAGGDIGLHVLEIMTSLSDSARSGGRRDLETSARLPELVPLTPREMWRNRFLAG